MNYESTINALFAQLATANLADSDIAQRWQEANDASQRAGFYGHIRAAIVAIAGEAIVEHWAETNEVDITLANRYETPTGAVLDCLQDGKAKSFHAIADATGLPHGRTIDAISQLVESGEIIKRVDPCTNVASINYNYTDYTLATS